MWCQYFVCEEKRKVAVAQPRGMRQLTLYEAFRIAPPAARDEEDEEQVQDPVLTARRCVVQEFWALLQFFVDTLPAVPALPPGAAAGEKRGNRAWAGSERVGVDHVFIRRVGPGDPPKYEVVMPAQVAAAAVVQHDAAQGDGGAEAG